MFYKFTTISGYLKNGEWHSYNLSGHWKKETAERFAKKRYSGLVSITHNVGDTSGGGRGGKEKRWYLDIEA